MDVSTSVVEPLETRPSHSTPTTPTTPMSDGDRPWVDPAPTASLTVESTVIGQIMGGRYRLDRPMEGGILGATYLAADLQAEEAPFAVHVLRPQIGRFSESLAHLRMEVRVNRMLRHPHIARVYSLISDRSGVYLVTEYMEGRSLAGIMQDFATGVPMIEARGVIADVGMALAYAHDLDVVHGDLQPANVFITHSDRAKLLHFGMSRAASTRNGRFDPRHLDGQSFAYASPEMLQGAAPDPRDDVFSLGCLIYTILSGAHPFESRSSLEARNLALAFAPLQILSRDQNLALGQALAFERDQRTPGVTALLAGMGWTAESPAVSAPTSAPATGLATEATSAEPLSPAGSVTSPPSAPGPQRNAPRRPPMPSVTADSRLPLVPRILRRFETPALLALSILLVSGGIGVYLYPEHFTPVQTGTRTALDPSPPAPPPASLPASPVASRPGGTVASTAPASPPRAAAVAIPRTAKPAAVSGMKTDSSVSVSVLRPLPKAAKAMADSDHCPYPREAVDRGLTGTVSLLVYVTAHGKPMKTTLDKTSGSEILDQAAVRCVEQFGRFRAPPRKSAGYWGRLRFTWSFGA